MKNVLESGNLFPLSLPPSPSFSPYVNPRGKTDVCTYTLSRLDSRRVRHIQPSARHTSILLFGFWFVPRAREHPFLVIRIRAGRVCCVLPDDRPIGYLLDDRAKVTFLLKS